MFGLFKSEPYVDQQLGKFDRSRGYWRGMVELSPHGKLDLLVTGSRSVPDSAALSAARELSSQYEQCREELAEKLYEHYRPYIQQRDEIATIEGSFPEISVSMDVWPHVYPQYVLIEGKNRTPVVEIAMNVSWDVEHTLAARIQGDRLIELCGSIRPLTG